jgi:CSLREA domain-containing protein
VQNGVITTSTVTFNATAGTTYRIVVDGWGGDAGTIKLNWTGCNVPTPTPTLTPSPTPTPTPTPQPCSGGFTVTDNGDASDANPGNGICATSSGACTLRAAIQEANALSTCGTIDINFGGVTSPISLGTVLPDVNHKVNINGPGANQLTVQRSAAGGTSNFRVLTISTGRLVTIAGITIANGNVPGGNGGGVLNSGTLTLTNSNIYGNSAGSGGGIYNDGSITLNNCNVGGSAAGQGNIGEGIRHNGGSGVVPNSGILVMNGGSIVANTGDGISIIATATLNGVSILQNSIGGGVFIATTSAGTTNIVNSLIANNTNASNGGFGGAGINNQSFGTVAMARLQRLGRYRSLRSRQSNR